MNETLCNRTFALFAAALLIAPAAFMAYTPPVQATPATLEEQIAQFGKEAYSALKEAYIAVKSAITSIAAVTSAAKETALVIERYVLQPLAYITTGNLLKKITSSMLGFIGGKNALGKPLYIQDMRGYIQNVGDVEAYSFLSQFQKNSNSPFASAITSSLRANYLQGTSLAGFFAANKSTLNNYSSDPKNYVAGNWTLGGWAAWFGLTTVDQNNPYIDAYLVSDQMNRQYQTAQTAKIVTAIGNQNYLNWCGSQGGTTAGGSGTVYDANGNPIDVTNTTDYNTSVGGDYGGGGDVTVSCPADTVQAGTVCACTNSNGCDVQDDGQPGYDANTFVLPTGDKCPDGSAFDNLYGGCEYKDDGTWTAVLDSSGSPVYQTDSSTNLDKGPNDPGKSLSDTSNSSTVLSALEGGKYFHYDPNGVGNYGGNCGVAVRQALCDVNGGSYCNGLGSGGASNWASVATASGWTQAASLTGVGTNAGLMPYLQDGDVVQTLPIGGHTYGHVCYMSGGTCYSDTNQGNIVPYADSRSNPNLKVVVWRAPGKTALNAKKSNVAVASAAGSSVRTGGYVLGTSSTNTTVSTSGLKPGDPCTKSDGTAGIVQTPGSTLRTYLDNTLKATGLDKLVQGAGDLSTQVNSILGDIGTVMKAVDMASNLFGGSSSGLLAFSGNSAYTSPFASYLNSSSYMGLTANTVYQNAQTTGVTSSDLASRVSSYQASWNAIGAAATAASANLNNIINTCSNQASAAQSALATYVTPQLTAWATAQANVTAANNLLAQAATDANASSDTGAYANDLQLETTQPPSATDVANAEAQSTSDGSAIASPAGSLNVSADTTIDELNLISSNAAAILSNTTLCPPPSDATSTTSTDPSTITTSTSDGGD